ncbi:MAG: sulfatase-like hydrolase/transferase [Candidatus Binatia bacterium]|nr:sulfatase-like hydrolase/transferase [Candidatus Binatia bacterium]
MSRPALNPTTRTVRFVGAVLVFAVAVTVSTIALDPARILLSPDVIEHVSIANALSLGHGFVNPVQWYYSLPGPPPLPAAASRAPVLPLLLAGAFSAGADLRETVYAHILFSALVAVGMFLLTCRFARPVLAAAATILVVTSPIWAMVSTSLLSEVTGLAACLLIVATAAGAGRARSGAIVCALATVLAWLTRPNLAPIALAVAVAIAWDVRRPRALLRSPVALYVLAVVAGTAVVSWFSTIMTGLPPYDGYRHVFEHFPEARAYRYGTEYVGTFTFIQAHFDKVVEACLSHASQLSSEFFTSSRYRFAGWWLLAGVLCVARSPSRATVEERVLALSGLGFSLMIVLTYPAFDHLRYPLFPAIFGILVGIGAVERTLQWVEARRPTFRWANFERPLWAGLIVLSAGLTWTIAAGSRSIAAAPETMSLDCSVLAPGELVMTDEPWSVHWMCGNPVIRVPADLMLDGIRDQFLGDFDPQYFIAYRKLWGQRAMRDPEMRLIPTAGPEKVFEIARESPPATRGPIIHPPACRLDPSPAPCTDLAAAPPATSPNVVLVVIDALRRDHLGMFGDTRPTSPNLDALAREGVLFTNLSSVSAQTAPAVSSLFTGRYPSESGVQLYARDLSFGNGRKRPVLDDSLTVLAESMPDAGYATAAVVSNP